MKQYYLSNLPSDLIMALKEELQKAYDEGYEHGKTKSEESWWRALDENNKE